MTRQEAIVEIDKIISTKYEKPTMLKDIVNLQKYIVINGAGSVGRDILRFLRAINVTPTCFIDTTAKDGQVTDGIPVYRPESDAISKEVKLNSLVLVSINLSTSQYESVKKSLLI